MMHRTITTSELQGQLDKLSAKLRAHEVHALYLGALTSTTLGLGPQKLLGAILGEAPMLGESLEDANAALMKDARSSNDWHRQGVSSNSTPRCSPSPNRPMKRRCDRRTSCWSRRVAIVSGRFRN